MQRSGEIEDVKETIHARARKILYHGIGNFARASSSGQGKICDSRKKFSKGEGGAKGQVSPWHVARRSSER